MRRTLAWFVVVVVGATLGLTAASTLGQGNGAANAPAPREISPSGKGRSGPAKAVVPHGTFTPQGSVPAPGPTIDADLYRSLKEEAERGGGPAGKRSGGAGAATPLAPPTQQYDVPGFSASFPFPPDTDGAAGNTQYVQVVNSRVRVVNKAPAGTTACADRSLNQFTISTEFVFDPRVIYDETWDRWVIVFTRRSTSATDTVRRYFLAVSTSSNACGSFFLYTVPFSGGPFNNGDWWDFPQLGQDQDTIFVTGNVFDTPASGSPFKGAALQPIAKARVYNGLGFSAPIFTGLVGTLAPPTLIAHDQDRDAIFLAAPPNGTHLREYTLRESSRPNGATLFGPTLIDVPDYAVPPSAEQPGTALTLDTGDNRFQNRHVQYTTNVGNIIVWQTHTVATGGFATPKFYLINATGNAVIQQGFFARSFCSDDWNPSIAANTLHEAVVTWSAVQDPANAQGCAAVNAEVRASGRQPQPADPAGSMNSPGVLVEGSATFYDDPESPTPERWGDYSAVSVNPVNAGSCAARRRFFLTNENIPTTNTNVWGSRISRFGFC